MINTKKSYSFEVSPQSVDFNYRITLSSLTDLLLTAAQYNAEENGFGLRKLNDQGLSWVLLRLAIETDYFPLQYETIHIETWIETVGRASTSRNFCIRNNEQKIIGYATSTWAMISHSTRKAQDLFTLDNICSYASGESVPIPQPAKLSEIEGVLTDTFSAKYSHIDINRHVNTMRYVEWISNSFSLEHYNSKRIKRFDINFMSEILFGEVVKIYCSNTDHYNFNFEITHQDKSSCRARLMFEDI
jgi:acyl-ACP thioesterase